MAELIYPQESNLLLGLAFQLHRELGCGFKEKVYQDCFEVLLKEHEVIYEREKYLRMSFHGVQIEHGFFYDFLCYNDIGIELKANKEILGEYEQQLINYLHVGRHQLGILLNFGTPSLQYKFIPNHHNYRRL